MEGYVLACSKVRDAELWFCELALGVLRCSTKLNGELVTSIQLTRHHVRVDAGIEGSCPNQFALHVTQAAFCEQTGRLLVANDREDTYIFAAPTGEAKKRWCRALQNWKRHAFDGPTSASIGRTIEEKAAKRQAYRREVETLMSHATTFELRLRFAKPARSEHDRWSSNSTHKIFRLSLQPTKSKQRKTDTKRPSLHNGRPSEGSAIASWIPSLRVPAWCRVRSNSPDHDTKGSSK